MNQRVYAIYFVVKEPELIGFWLYKTEEVQLNPAQIARKTRSLPFELGWHWHVHALACSKDLLKTRDLRG